jgi:hypothetical protein
MNNVPGQYRVTHSTFFKRRALSLAVPCLLMEEFRKYEPSGTSAAGVGMGVASCEREAGKLIGRRGEGGFGDGVDWVASGEWRRRRGGLPAWGGLRVGRCPGSINHSPAPTITTHRHSTPFSSQFPLDDGWLGAQGARPSPVQTTNRTSLQPTHFYARCEGYHHKQHLSAAL